MEATRLVFKSLWILGWLGVFSACTPGEESASAAQDLYATFEQLAPSDTLHVGLDSMASGKVLDFEGFFAAVDSSLLEDMIYEVDSTDGSLRALWKVALDEDYDLCLLELRQNWFQFRYGLVYATEARQFIHLEPMAYFYGGEGGQLFSESWLLNQRLLISRESERAIRWTVEGETQESIRSSLSAQTWSSSQFRELAVPDSVFWMQKELAIGF